ncbi:hypothetical protein P7C70_g1360, partial [Phenoliferia sp. Uapishka_3]
MELPYLLVESMASLTTSTFVCHSTSSPPCDRRTSSLNRATMLSQRSIPIQMEFSFAPRKSSDPRKMFSLQLAKILTRKQIDEQITAMDNSTTDSDGGRTFAQTEAREEVFLRGKNAMSFYVMCTVYIADSKGRDERQICQSMVFRARMRQNALENPAKGSEDWFKFIKGKLDRPQEDYRRLDGVEVHVITEQESQLSFWETVRLIAVKKCKYPPEKKFDIRDPSISQIIGVFQAADSRAPKGFNMPQAALNWGKEVLDLQKVYHDQALRTVLAMRES